MLLYNIYVVHWYYVVIENQCGKPKITSRPVVAHRRLFVNRANGTPATAQGNKDENKKEVP